MTIHKHGVPICNDCKYVLVGKEHCRLHNINLNVFVSADKWRLMIKPDWCKSEERK